MMLSIMSRILTHVSYYNLLSILFSDLDMFPFAELVDNYFADDDQDSRNSGDDENPVEVLMKTYFSLSYSDCCDNNPFAADIRTRFIRDFRSLIDEFEDKSEDKWGGISSCADHGWKVPFNSTTLRVCRWKCRKQFIVINRK